MLALAGFLLLGFAFAVWIFTQATDSLGFMGVLSLASWLIALIFGFRFLKDAGSSTGAVSKGPFSVWSIIFLLVTLQTPAVTESPQDRLFESLREELGL